MVRFLISILLLKIPENRVIFVNMETIFQLMNHLFSQVGASNSLNSLRATQKKILSKRRTTHRLHFDQLFFCFSAKKLECPAFFRYLADFGVFEVFFSSCLPLEILSEKSRHNEKTQIHQISLLVATINFFNRSFCEKMLKVELFWSLSLLFDFLMRKAKSIQTLTLLKNEKKVLKFLSITFCLLRQVS